MIDLHSRRKFMHSALAGSAAVGLGGMSVARAAVCDDPPSEEQPLYKISLAQWSLHRMLQSPDLDNLSFSRVAKEEFGIDAVEYCSRFFTRYVSDQDYLNELRTRADDLDVKILLIMCGRLGDVLAPDEAARTEAIETHCRWVEAAKVLGCHSIRVNARSQGSYEDQRDRAINGLSRLSEFAADYEINVIVENHGGMSANGQWITEVMQGVNLSNCGTLPDFGNFDRYDRYQGVEEMMPFAKAVSAKSKSFDAQGNETQTDYRRMMEIVVNAGYRGYVGIEYEGRRLSEYDGIRATKQLLERVRTEIAETRQAEAG